MPDGQVQSGVQLRLVGSATPDFMMDEDWNSQQHGNARFSESGFDDQLLVADVGASNQNATYETGFYRNPSFASDSHAVQAKPDTGLPDVPSQPEAQAPDPTRQDSRLLCRIFFQTDQ